MEGIKLSALSVFLPLASSLLLTACLIRAQVPPAVNEDWLKSHTFRSTVETTHYSLKADLPDQDTRMLGRHMEDFVKELLARGYLPSVRDPDKTSAYFLRDQDWDEIDSSRATYGFWDGRRIFVNYDLGIGTANHEIVHQLLKTSGVRRDDFDSEGLAMAFEKTITFYSSRPGVPAVTFDYLHPRRTQYALQFLQDRFGSNDQDRLDWLLSIGRKEAGAAEGADEYDVVGTLFNYMLREGKLPAYTALLGSDLDRRERLEKAFGYPLEKVWADYLAWLRACPADPDYELVLSTFVAQGGDSPTVNGRPTRFDAKTGRWTFRQP